ncbi:MAG: hypothetical protein ACXVYY_01070 [Oryzihumus sp.]
MTTFLRRPPLSSAIDKANRDVRGKVSVADLNWLHDHPVTWVQALQALIHDTEGALAKGKLHIAALQSDPARTADLAEVQRRQLTRRHYLDKCLHRRDEVASLIGFETFTFASDARLVTLLTEAENRLEEGDSDEAGDILAQALDSMAATTARLHADNVRSA